MKQLAAVQFVRAFFCLELRQIFFTFSSLSTLIFGTIDFSSILERSTASLFEEVQLHTSFQAG
jgi:hypothetical protein